MLRFFLIGLIIFAAAQASAPRPVRIVVPFGPGAPDTVGRLLAPALHDDVVEKRPDQDLKHEWDPAEWKAKEDMMARIFIDFLKRTIPG